MSPRRSSRARQNPPLTDSLKPSNSNASSSSGRNERPPRSVQRHESFHKSISSDILPLGGHLAAMEAAEQQARQTRQKKRGLDIQDYLDYAPAPGEIVEEEEELEEEEEVTRCVCRRQEYPGPPVPLEEGSRSHRAKDHNNGSTIIIPEALSDDAGSLFIQCDSCKVWQHGGCVGIMDESMSPENYYCEECRGYLHKLMVGARGQRYSRYLPVYEALHPPAKAARKSPPTKDSDSRSSRDPEPKGTTTSAAAAATAAAVAAANLSSAKRRSTMNSRAAMDEEEAFRKAIEESRTDGSSAGTVNGSRKGKRARDDSEEQVGSVLDFIHALTVDNVANRGKHDLKRRKTGSEEDSPKDADLALMMGESDEEGTNLKSRTSNAARKAKAGAAQVQREKDIREREKERERERNEAANRRRGRADKRHADESDPGEDLPRPGTATKSGTSARAPKSNVLNRVQATAAASPTPNPPTSHKKQNKTAPRRPRSGRNLASRDTNLDGKTDSPRHSLSRDGETGLAGPLDASAGLLLSNGSKPSRPRPMHPNKTTMNDLRKRAAAILEFISRTQVEMAAEKTSPGNTTPNDGVPIPPVVTRPPLARNMSVNGMSKLSRQVEGEEGETVAEDRERVKVDEKVFRQMSTTQMMDVLTRELVHWQKEFGRTVEK